MNLANTLTVLSRLKIRDRDSARVVPFRFNYNQQLAWKKIEFNEVNRRPHNYIFLKSRRVGISSLIDGIGFCHCLGTPGANGLILAHTHDSSKELFKVPKGLADTLPFSLPPATTRDLIFPHRDGKSRLSIATAGRSTTGRGWTLSFLHISEAAYLPSGVAFSSLLPAVSDHPSSWKVIESTANGVEYEGEAFYNLWQASTEGQTEWTPVFLTWLDDPTCVRPAEFAVDAPIDDEEKFLMEELKATLEQIAWRRVMLASPTCRGQVEVFNQEYPSTPDRAFVSSGYPAFDVKDLERARKTVAAKQALITGNLAINSSGAPEFIKDQNGPLSIWEKPQEKHAYYLGADAARGMDTERQVVTGDFSAFTIFNGSTGEQAARFHDHTSPESTALLINGMGRYFNNAMVNVEFTGNLGYEVYRRLRDDYHYPNLYRWRGRDDRLDKVKRMTTGFETTERTRDMLHATFRSSIREDELTIYDPVLLSQMQQATMKYGRWTVAKGHDDVLISAMLAWIARVHWPPTKLIRSKGDVLPEDLRVDKSGDPPSIVPAAQVNAVSLGKGLSYQAGSDTTENLIRLSGVRHMAKVQGYLKAKKKAENAALRGI